MRSFSKVFFVFTLLFHSPAFAVDASAVAARLRQQVPLELTVYFDTILYVSKAAEGPWAQQMFVFRRQEDGQFELDESFAVSTGRERREQYFTTTPTGIFEIDPNRIYRMVHSARWGGAAMPYSMFIDYSYRTVKSGIALHAAAGRQNLANLGSRASGGCIRVPPEKAEQFFNQVQNGSRGMVPILAFDESAGTTNRSGIMVRDAAGKPRLKSGITVLLVVDDYPGTEPVRTVGVGGPPDDPLNHDVHLRPSSASTLP